MTPTTTCKGKEFFPAVILPSGKTRNLTTVGFYSERVALDLATQKVAKGYLRPLTTKPKVDVNLETPCPIRYQTPVQNQIQAHSEFPSTTKRLPYEPTRFANPAPHHAVDGGLQYQTPDVHKTDESHGSLDYLGVPNTLPDQTEAQVTAVELCRLFGVDRNLMQMQTKVDVNLSEYEMGRRAAWGGKGKRSCPHVKGGIVYYDWMDGFNSYNAGEPL